MLVIALNPNIGDEKAALIPLALSSNPQANAQSLTTNGESGAFLQPSTEDVPSPQNEFGGPKRIQGQTIQAASLCQSPTLSSRVACTIALCLALGGIIAHPTTCHAQSPSEWTPATSENARKPDGHAAWGSVPTRKASVANLAPALLPYFNNGPVFGLPGTEGGDFRHRTQLSGDWGGMRTDLARHGFFFDLYSTSAYQNVASGGLKNGNTSIQNTQLSINVDTGRAGLWSGGIFHITLESRYGSSSPQNTFTVGSTVPQYTGLAIPGPFFVHDVLPTEYFLFQSLTPKFAVLLGKTNVLKHADQTLFGNSYKYYFANLNFNKNPMALNFYNTTSLAAVGLWIPSKRLTVFTGVFDPNSDANNLATKAFDRVNVYGGTIFSYKIGNLPGQSWAQANWTNKPKIDLTSPFGQLSPAGVPQAVGVLLGAPSVQALPVKYKGMSWVTIGNFSQYLFVKDHPAAVAEKLGSGQPLRGIGLFGRLGYAPEETNPITRDASVALLANGLSDHRPNDSFGLGIYHNGISQPLKNEIARLTGATATLKNEQGLEVFYSVAITPAMRLIPSYQHIWNPMTAEVAKNERGADVFLLRLSLTF
jgi:porin